MVDHLDAMGVAVYVKDLQGRYVAINRAGAGLLGRPAEQILGGNDFDLFAPRDAQITMMRDRFVVCQREPLAFSSAARLNAREATTAFHTIKIALRHRPRQVAAGLLGLSFALRGASVERETSALLLRIAQYHQGELLTLLRRQARLFAVS